MIRFFIVVSAVMCLSSLTNAYAQGARPPHQGVVQEDFKGMPVLSAQERAEKMTQEMDEVVSLGQKQYKKILSPDQYSTWRRIHPDPTGFFHK